MMAEDSPASLPGRRQQIKLLSALMGKTGSCALPGLFVYGHTATGKTTVIKHVMRAMQHTYVSVSCIECYSSRLMFETILGDLHRCIAASRGEGNEGDTCLLPGRCDNMNDFVNQLRSLLLFLRPCDQSHSVYILFENAERLRDADVNLLPALLRIQELSGLNVGVVLESEIVWEKFRTGAGFREPVIVHFPDYTKEDLLDIISLDAPLSYPASFYRGYVSLLLSVFYIVCVSLNELRYQARVNFSRYIEPVEKGELTVEDSHKLWRCFEPRLKKSLQTVYLREIHGGNVVSGQKTTGETTATSMSRATQSLELPVYSKYLLIAAYLASYNPAKSDKRFFVKLSGRRQKRALTAASKKHERTTNQMLGPKFFPLDRLMAIFYSIVEGRVAPTANIFCQISSLVTLGLLAHVSGAESLDCPKYKCLVSLEFVKTISRSVNFEVVRYIYELL